MRGSKLIRISIVLGFGLLFMGQTIAQVEAQEKGSSKTMIEQMPMSPQMKKRMQAMMNTPIFLDSPCAVYGQRDRLRLTDEQKSQLIKIENEARQKALAVLTPEQKATLGDLPEKPMAMMQMCQNMSSKMMPMMKEMMGEGGMEDMMKFCPMMGMMKEKGEVKGSNSSGMSTSMEPKGSGTMSEK